MGLLGPMGAAGARRRGRRRGLVVGAAIGAAAAKRQPPAPDAVVGITAEQQINEIERLAALKKQGAITEEEFKIKKKEILES